MRNVRVSPTRKATIDRMVGAIEWMRKRPYFTKSEVRATHHISDKSINALYDMGYVCDAGMHGRPKRHKLQWNPSATKTPAAKLAVMALDKPVVGPRKKQPPPPDAHAALAGVLSRVDDIDAATAALRSTTRDLERKVHGLDTSLGIHRRTVNDNTTDAAQVLRSHARDIERIEQAAMSSLSKIEAVIERIDKDRRSDAVAYTQLAGRVVLLENGLRSINDTLDELVEVVTRKLMGPTRWQRVSMWAKRLFVR